MFLGGQCGFCESSLAAQKCRMESKNSFPINCMPGTLAAVRAIHQTLRTALGLPTDAANLPDRTLESAGTLYHPTA